MILDRERKFIYISVPKTASISIQFSLGFGNNIPEPPLYHQGILTALQNHPEAAEFKKFSMVRNPWDRILSLYKDFTLKRVYQYSALVRMEQPLFSEFTDFTDFCLRIGESRWMDDIFLQSQSKLLGVGQVKMDFVGRFESLQDSFSQMCAIIGITCPLLRMNEGVYEKGSYRKYYTDAAASAIAQLYAQDIREYGYEF